MQPMFGFLSFYDKLTLHNLPHHVQAHLSYLFYDVLPFWRSQNLCISLAHGAYSSRCCFAAICSNCRRQSSSSTNPRSNSPLVLHLHEQFQKNARPQQALDLLARRRSNRFSIAPCLPISIAFCPVRSQ